MCCQRYRKGNSDLLCMQKAKNVESDKNNDDNDEVLLKNVKKEGCSKQNVPQKAKRSEENKTKLNNNVMPVATKGTKMLIVKRRKCKQKEMQEQE